MSAPRAIPDFTAVSRRSFEAALRRVSGHASPISWRFVSAETAAPPSSEGERLVAALIEGQPFRLASRHAGLSRRAAKQWLERAASNAIALHVSHLARVPAPDVVHGSARVFALKRGRGQASAVRARDETFLWTHLWLDPRSRLIVAWMIGSSNAVWPAGEHASADVASAFQSAVEDMSSAGSGGRGASAGVDKKIREHGLVISLLAAAWNCAIDISHATPAQRAGWTERPWPATELAAAVCRG